MKWCFKYNNRKSNVDKMTCASIRFIRFENRRPAIDHVISCLICFWLRYLLPPSPESRTFTKPYALSTIGNSKVSPFTTLHLHENN